MSFMSNWKREVAVAANVPQLYEGREIEKQNLNYATNFI